MTTQEHIEEIKARCQECLTDGRDNGVDKWTGPAEAGWRATIAAIEWAQFMSANGQVGEGLLEHITAAWPEELL